MGRKCVVLNCNSGYESCKEKVSLFRIPYDVKKREKWQNAIGRTDRELTLKDRVCEKHFLPHEIINLWRWNPKGLVPIDVISQRPRLQEDVIPSVFTNCYRPQYKLPSDLLPASNSQIGDNTPLKMKRRCKSIYQRYEKGGGKEEVQSKKKEPGAKSIAMMQTKCCVYGCNERYKKDGQITFHSFPNDPKRRQVWANTHQSIHFVNANSRICSRHFTGDSFTTLDNLKKNAVPSIFVSRKGKRKTKVQSDDSVESEDEGPTYSAPEYLMEEIPPDIKEEPLNLDSYSTQPTVWLPQADIISETEDSKLGVLQPVVLLTRHPLTDQLTTDPLAGQLTEDEPIKKVLVDPIDSQPQKKIKLGKVVHPTVTQPQPTKVEKMIVHSVSEYPRSKMLETMLLNPSSAQPQSKINILPRGSLLLLPQTTVPSPKAAQSKINTLPRGSLLLLPQTTVPTPEELVNHTDGTQYVDVFMPPPGAVGSSPYFTASSMKILPQKTPQASLIKKTGNKLMPKTTIKPPIKAKSPPPPVVYGPTLDIVFVRVEENWDETTEPKLSVIETTSVDADISKATSWIMRHPRKSPEETPKTGEMKETDSAQPQQTSSEPLSPPPADLEAEPLSPASTDSGSDADPTEEPLPPTQVEPEPTEVEGPDTQSVKDLPSDSHIKTPELVLVGPLTHSEETLAQLHTQLRAEKKRNVQLERQTARSQSSKLTMKYKLKVAQQKLRRLQDRFVGLKLARGGSAPRKRASAPRRGEESSTEVEKEGQGEESWTEVDKEQSDDDFTWSET